MALIARLSKLDGLHWARHDGFALLAEASTRPTAPRPPTNQNIDFSLLFVVRREVGVSGGLESVRENHTSRLGRFRIIWSLETPGNLPKSFPLSLQLLTRLRSFFFVPGNPRSHFGENLQKTRAGK